MQVHQIDKSFEIQPQRAVQTPITAPDRHVLESLMARFNYPVLVFDAYLNFQYQSPAMDCIDANADLSNLPSELKEAILKAIRCHELPALISISVAGTVESFLLDVLSSAHDKTIYFLLGTNRTDRPSMRMQAFKSALELTTMETLVLERLLTGLVPKQIAQLHDVSVSTVRTQVKTIRQKAGERNTGGILTRINMFPSLVNLR